MDKDKAPAFWPKHVPKLLQLQKTRIFYIYNNLCLNQQGLNSCAIYGGKASEPFLNWPATEIFTGGKFDEGVSGLALTSVLITFDNQFH